MSAATRPAAERPSRAARAEAAAWIAQLHGPQRSPELEADFRSWLEADPEHARAFERVTEVWDAVGSVNVGGLPRFAQRSARAAADAPRIWPRAAAALLACSVVAVGAYWLLRSPFYSTEIGELRMVTLDDGSRVALNSNTRMTIDYRETERRVRLERGEALFEVAANPQRPFTVTAGDRQVTALGTSFVVRYDPDRIAVTLLEGKVAVAPLSADAQSASGHAVARTLRPGQRLTVLANQAERLDTPQIDVATAWRRGEVMLDDTLLADAVAEMNRYDKTALLIDSANVAALRVSGIYRTGDSEGFARTVATMYGLAVVEEGGQIHLREGRVPSEESDP